jgi:hypothetical protein
MNRKVLLQSTILALGLEGALQAQTWDYGAATRNWTDALNWNGDVVPTTGVVTINNATAGQTPIIATTVSRTGADTFVGNGAAGTLDINSGGSVSTSTKWIFVGNGTAGNGTLNVNTGGTLTSDNDIRLATSPATGKLNVNGGTITVARVVSGLLGTISVSNGGKLTTTGTSTSNGAPDIVRLTTSSFGAGSLVSSARDVSYAAGASSISGGSLSGAGQIFLGQGVTNSLDISSGSATSGSWMVVGINASGNGTINLSGTGVVNATNVSTTAFTTIGANNNAVGIVNQSGGTWNQGGLGIILSEGGTATGTYNLDGGDLNTPRIYSNTANGRLNLNGGTLHATKDAADFISSNLVVDVKSGGAKNDSNGFNITTAANLAGVGSLEKQGAGSLNLTGTGNSVDTATVSLGTLYISGALAAANGTTVDSGATIAAGDFDGGSLSGDLHLALGSTIDISNGLLTVDSGSTVSFGGFGFSDIAGFDVFSAASGTYTVLGGTFTLDSTNISNFGLANALDLGGGKSAYFQAGSLSVVVIPEPSAVLLGSIGVLALLRRRRF